MRGGVRAEPRGSRLGYVIAAFAGWAVGIMLQFYPMLLSGMQRVEGNRSDSRLVNYILEHGYQWLLGMPGHERFWSPPAFYPAPDTAAYSDVLLGVAPLYWLWRMAGLAPDGAFQLWMLSLATLSFAFAFVLFSSGFRCRPVASAAGALLLCFAAMRTSQVMHAQLIAIFYIAIALLAMLRIFEPEPELRAGIQMVERRTLWVLALAAACVAQLYASVYYGWFLCFAIVLAALWSLVLPRTRRRFLLTIRTNASALVIATALSALALAPLMIHYLGAEHQVGPRNFDLVDGMLPRVESWMYFGAGSWLYGWLTPYPAFRGLPLEHEQQLGIGIATTLLAAFGLWLARRRPSVQLIVLVPLTMALLATRWPGGFSLWHAVYLIVPGAGALRAISRIGVAILFPASLGVSLVINAISRSRRIPPSRAAVRIRKRDQRRRAIVVFAIIAVVVAEQVGTPRSFDREDTRARVARIAGTIGAPCDAFLYTTIGGDDDPWSYQVDAMWASMARGVPTINGYSGAEPPGWFFYDIRVRTAQQDSVINESLARWEARWKLDPSRVCRARTSG
jgi:hypothetical protein